MEELRTQWHAAFCSAMELILEDDQEHLEFIREYNLNTKPLEVDLLVIKKTAGYDVKDVIGRIFQEHNLFEYKSPDDKLNIDTFYKVNAYACLYKASAKHVDEIKARHVTITLIREEKPKKLLQDLEKEGFVVGNPYKGIYYISGRAYFPTQIIVSKELEGGQHVWLRALTKKLDRMNAENLLRQVRSRRQRGMLALADAVLAVSIKENGGLFNKIKEDADMCEALRELMADEINAEVTAKVNARTAALREEIKAEAKEEVKAEVKEEVKAEVKEEVKAEVKEEVKAEVKEEVKAEVKKEVKAEVKEEVKAEAKAQGLQVLIEVLKNMQLDFEAAYRNIVRTAAYADISKEQVMKYWK